MKRTLGGIAIGLLAGAVIFGGLTAAGALTTNAQATMTRSQDASHSVTPTGTPAPQPMPQPAPTRDATHTPDPGQHLVEAQHQTRTMEQMTDHTATAPRESITVHHPEPAHTAAPAPAPAPAPEPTHMMSGDGEHHGGESRH